MMMSNNMLEKVQQYRDLQIRHEELTDAIHALLREHKGGTDRMSKADLKRYRELARERDDVDSEMRYLQQLLFGDYDET